MTTKKKPVGKEWLNPIGKTTLLRVDWRDWKKEQPKSCEDIVVIVKDKAGDCGPFHATYFDETIPAGKTFPETRFRRIEFREFGLGTIYLGSKEEKYLIAWGRLKVVKQLISDCPICKQLICQC
jgi:hypothetical protein